MRAALLLLVACSADPTRQTPECQPGAQDPCPPGPCPGWRTCSPEGTWGVCVWRVPEPEVCDGIDNDCVGGVDKGIEPTRCGSDVGACSQGWLVCSGGALVCQGGHTPSPETCNGADDDCDGETDEGLNPTRVEDFRPCYAGPPGTLGVGVCRPGWLVCREGAEVCDGQVLPTRGDCRTGGDLDCDGTPDPVASAREVDVVIAVDLSGSMGSILPGASAELARFADHFAGGTRVQAALVLQPGRTDMTCTWAEPLGDPGRLVDGLRRLTITASGMEPTIDCAYEAGSVPAWRPGARRLFLSLTDEDPQSYTVPDRTLADAAASLAGAGVEAHPFVTPAIEPLWRPLADGTGGVTHELGPWGWERDLYDLLIEEGCR